MTSLPAVRTLPRLLFRLCWAAVVALGVFFIWRDVGKHFFHSERFLGMTPNKEMILHITTATVALLVGPIQFLDKVRRKWPHWHRRAGWAYVVSGILSVPSMYVLGYRSFCPMCTPPFFLWTTVFLGMTVTAVIMALRRNITAHRQFMIRSYVLLNGFVFTRIDEFIPFPFPDGPGIERNSMVIWTVWVVPLILTELWLTWLPAVRRRPRRQGRAAET